MPSKKSSKKIWDKGNHMDQFIEQFTVGKDRDLDVQLSEYDILGSLAHVIMLEKVGLLSSEELTGLRSELIKLFALAHDNKLTIEEGVEDIHSQIELMLTRSLGDIGKKIHSGRSRNDQVLVDLKLYARNQIQKLVVGVEKVFDQLLYLSEKYQNVILPGYTHLQIAMPSSFGLWFGAYAESLADDMILIQAAYKITNKNPLGSAAGYGSSFALDRKLTTELLGFEDLHYNSVYAQMSRGKTERVVSQTLASVASTISKMAMDITLYLNQNFAFVSFPDNLTTGSSIMPHKKNPDVFEIIRARCNKIIALPNEISLLISNLPSGYFRDLQVVKENFLPMFGELIDCIYMLNYTLKNIEINKNILDDPKYNYLFTVEAVNQLVQEGVPFRTAYRDVAEKIEKGTFVSKPNIEHTHEGSIGNLCNDQIMEAMRKTLAGFDFASYEKAIEKLLEN